MASLLNMSGGSLLGKGLPYDAEIEYLISSGDSYIDTGYFPKRSTGIFVGSNNKAYTWGCSFQHDGTDYWLGVYVSFFYAYTASTGNVLRQYDKRNFEVANGTAHNDGLDTRTFSYSPIDFTFDSSLMLFGWNVSGTRTACGADSKIFYCRITEGDTVILDFIPVRKGTTGYMYDKVSGQLFGNQGTGSFILGPDK